MKQNKTAVADSVAEYVGRDVGAIIRELLGKKDYSEFKLAEALGAEVNETRNLLYKLHSLNLASFIKKKDNKKGWYIYYWTFHDEKVGAFLLNEKRSRLALLREKISKEKDGSFFSCKTRCGRLDFDKAVDFSFRCPECGELLAQDNNKVAEAAALGAELVKLEKEVKLLESGERRVKDARFIKNVSLEMKNEKERTGKKTVIKGQGSNW